MRNIRSKRIKTEGVYFFAGPFQDSVLEIQLDKHRQCLIAVQKNQFEKAWDLLHQIIKDEAKITIHKRQQNMIEFLTINAKAYLFLREAKYQDGLKCLQDGRIIKYNEERRNNMRLALPELIKSCIFCQIGKLEQSKQSIKNAFQSIKTVKIHEQFELNDKNLQKYNEIFIIFYDMIAYQLSKMAKFQQILNIYRQCYHLSIRILGKDHKLTSLMQRIILQNSNQVTLSSKTGSNKSEKGMYTKIIRSKKKLKINEERMPLLSTKQKQMKRIYKDNDEILLSKLGMNQNRLTKRDQTYYLKSLERVKSIYNSRNQCRTQQISEDNAEMSKQSSFFTKMATQSRYQYSRRRIKDIILKGRKLNKDMICVRQDASNTDIQFETVSQDPIIEQPVVMSTIYIAKKEQPKKIEVENREDKLSLKKIAEKVEVKEAKKEECQLI